MVASDWTIISYLSYYYEPTSSSSSPPLAAPCCPALPGCAFPASCGHRYANLPATSHLFLSIELLYLLAPSRVTRHISDSYLPYQRRAKACWTCTEPQGRPARPLSTTTSSPTYQQGKREKRSAWEQCTREEEMKRKQFPGVRVLEFAPHNYLFLPPSAYDNNHNNVKLNKNKKKNRTTKDV